jgi:hypothetical protein
MKKQEWLLSLLALGILFSLRLMLNENFITLNRFWWLLGLYGLIVIALNIVYQEFRFGLVVTTVILLILFGVIPVPYHWLAMHKLYFSLNLLITSLLILGYCAFAVFLMERITTHLQGKRLHT